MSSNECHDSVEANALIVVGETILKAGVENVYDVKSIRVRVINERSSFHSTDMCVNVYFTLNPVYTEANYGLD